MKKPFGITVLALILVFTAVWNGLRLVEAIFLWKTLGEYGANELYLAISGGFWLLAALSIAGAIWWKRTWAWAGTIGYALGYASWYWFDRLVLQKPHSNWPFALCVTVISLLIVFLILFSPHGRKYFSKS